MSEDGISLKPSTTVCSLPAEPVLERWQPLRLGVVELFHYDVEEFWFHDGRLLLRGNNGTGKSKLLSLTLPFLFDANLRSSRIEPDGDSGKKMAWNLLVGSYKRRVGYAWIEFGRRDRDGQLHYLTLGAGLSAVEGRPGVEAWFFMLTNGENGGSRIGRDFRLTNEHGNVLTRDRLREAIEGHGKLFDNATLYRRAVDEKLFCLGEKRYDALMDTLIQLRQPQLSRKPDEAGLSHALTEALPPMPADMLTDVADSLNQLEEDRRQLDDIRALHKAVDSFNNRYERYARIQSRRRARELRQAQTEFDNASQSRNAARSILESALAAEAEAVEALENVQSHLNVERARLETLRSNPTMQDANRLQNSEQDLERRRRAVASEERTSEQFQARLLQEASRTEECTAKVRSVELSLLRVRNECMPYAERAGLAVEFGKSHLGKALPSELAMLASRDFDLLATELRNATTARRDAIMLLQQRRRAVDQADMRLKEMQRIVEDAKIDVSDASGRRAEADMDAERAGQVLIDEWCGHTESLVQLKIDTDQFVEALTEWVAKPEGENPANVALRLAYQERQTQYASDEAALNGQCTLYERQISELEAERNALRSGRDPTPPVPYVRREEERTQSRGAPFYSLVDFREQLDEAQCAGLEAALEASGLLDAWVGVDGCVCRTDGEMWLDSQWTSRPVVSGESLADWLKADCLPEGPVSADIVRRLLSGVGCAVDETSIDASCEAWVSPSGRFRLGSLSGEWTKSQALYIGQRARTAARLRRLEAIRIELESLHACLAGVHAGLERLAEAKSQAGRELSTVPADKELLKAMQTVALAMRDLQFVRTRLDRAEAQSREAEQVYQTAMDLLRNDAADLRLPIDDHALAAVEEALVYCSDKFHDVVSLGRDYRRVQPDLSTQREREYEVRLQYQECLERLGEARLESEEAQVRYETLRDTVGAEVASLMARLNAAKDIVSAAEERLKTSNDARRAAAENRATAAQKTENAQVILDERIDLRERAVVQLQRFASSSLLSSALPDLELPDSTVGWTIDPALTVARRIEQALGNVADDDDSWTRVQKHVNEDLMDLQRTLGALGHQAIAETSDWGLIVHVIFHGKHERPDQLATRLADEMAQRAQLLSAHERAVLENHLQADIATEIQRMLRAADAQVSAVNKELEKRPTSTGVRYRLRWQPLSELDGAPAGLEAARERLLNTSADLWSMEDRRVVGNMLHLQIKAERDRSESAMLPGTGETGGSLFDQLSRALDYRRWHRFRVERLQAGQWKKLSGPASSGERALGLTVPLFAAIASFYSQSSNPNAPRLMLLDEAFAGIDDSARAHCMGLIREFDLDFVITSEREWACYAELPGVAICQLQRREGVDAVFVSRWIWDGKARRGAPEPDRYVS